MRPAQPWEIQQAELGALLGCSLGQGRVRFSACPAVLHLQDSRRPIHFPGCVPNSVVLQQMWQPGQVGGLEALCQLMGSRPKARGGAGGWGSGVGLQRDLQESPQPLALPLQVGHSRDDLGLRQGGWRHHAKWQQNLLQWLGDAEEQGELVLDLASDSLSPHGQLSDQLLESREQEAEVGRQGAVAGPRELLGEEGSAAVAAPLPRQSSRFLLRKPSGSPDTTIRKESYFCRPQDRHGRSLWGERYGHLPRFLHFLIGQNWFKRLFPIFTLEVRGALGAWGLGCGRRWRRRVGPQHAVPAGVP